MKRLEVLHAVADDARETCRLDARHHYLGGARPSCRIGGFRLEQLGVGEHHAELIAQVMKQRPQIKLVERRLGRICGAICQAKQIRGAHAAGAGVASASRWAPSGCRQSVSTKIRTLPPAVRTYSTFPAAIQL